MTRGRVLSWRSGIAAAQEDIDRAVDLLYEADREGLRFLSDGIWGLHTVPEFLPYLDDPRLREFLLPKG